MPSDQPPRLTTWSPPAVRVGSTAVRSLIDHRRRRTGQIPFIVDQVEVRRPVVEHADIALRVAGAGIEPEVVDRFGRRPAIEAVPVVQGGDVGFAIDGGREVPGRLGELREPARTVAGGKPREHMHDRDWLRADDGGAVHRRTIEVHAVDLVEDAEVIFPGPVAQRRPRTRAADPSQPLQRGRCGT